MKPDAEGCPGTRRSPRRAQCSQQRAPTRAGSYSPSPPSPIARRRPGRARSSRQRRGPASAARATFLHLLLDVLGVGGEHVRDLRRRLSRQDLLRAASRRGAIAAKRLREAADAAGEDAEAVESRRPPRACSTAFGSSSISIASFFAFGIRGRPHVRLRRRRKRSARASPPRGSKCAGS